VESDATHGFGRRARQSIYSFSAPIPRLYVMRHFETRVTAAQALAHRAAGDFVPRDRARWRRSMRCSDGTTAADGRATAQSSGISRHAGSRRPRRIVAAGHARPDEELGHRRLPAHASAASSRGPGWRTRSRRQSPIGS
jgi:hypothetical protein